MSCYRAVVCTLLFASPLAADELGPLVTDRPDQTESTATVPKGYWQIETGVVLAKDEDSGFEFEELNVANTLVRLGLSDRLELRIGWDGYRDTKVRGFFGFDEDGIGDANLGLKFNLREGGGLSPSVAVIASTSVPVGDELYTSDAWDPTLRLSVAHELSDRVAFGWNLGAYRETFSAGDFSDDDTFAFFTASFAFSVNDKVGIFTEVFGEFDWDESSSRSYQFDTGLTYLLRDNAQLDFSVGAGLNDDALDYFIGAGVSFRLPG